MDLKISQREQDGIHVLTLEGRITMGQASDALREELATLLEGGKKRIVLNMAGVTLIASWGIGTLMWAHTTATKQGVQILLAELSDFSEKTLKIVGISEILKPYKTEADALASLGVSRSS